MRIAVAIVSGCGTGSPMHERRAILRLAIPSMRGRFVVDAVVGVLGVALPVGGDVPRIPDRYAVNVGRFAERVADLERGGLLPFDAERVDRVHDRHAAAFAELAHEVERVVEVAADRHDLRAVDERLRELAERDVTVGDDDGARSCPARAA